MKHRAEASSWFARRHMLALVACGAIAVTSCAPKVPPPTVPVAPRYPDFVFPTVPDNLGDARIRGRHDLGWRYFQSGNLGSASKEFTEALKRAPAFYPAETGLGYVLVAEARPKDALVRFERVLQKAPRYAPALAGRGEAFVANGQPDLAIASFEAARAADPTLSDLGRRIDILRFDRVNDLVANATRAANAGRLDEARQAYEQAIGTSPDSAFLYRDAGLVDVRAGLFAAAITHLERAVSLDSGDARAWLALADAREKNGQFDEAAAALERALEVEPSEAVRKALERLRDRAALARLPAEYRALASAAQIDRGGLAALLGVRVLPVTPAARRNNAGVVLTDTRSHWASTWIMGVTRAGFMDAYSNHTFQPRSPVRRVDLAVAVSRVLAVLPPVGGRPARAAIPDLALDHLSYPAVAAAVASGVMPLVEGGLFRPFRAVSGAEAVDVIGRLEALAKRTRPGAPRN